MAQPGAPQALITAAILALIAWRLYTRIRRTIGRQRLSPVRPWITVVLFPLLILLLGFTSRSQPVMAGSLACGVGVGIGLGALGLRLTRFEVSAEGLYYTPSAHLGIALSALLVCRIVYRVIVGGLPGAGTGVPPPATALGPLTLLLVGTLAGYYSAYAVGLLRWSLRNPATNTSRREPPP